MTFFRTWNTKGKVLRCKKWLVTICFCCMEKSTINILHNISFCVPLEKGVWKKIVLKKFSFWGITVPLMSFCLQLLQYLKELFVYKKRWSNKSRHSKCCIKMQRKRQCANKYDTTQRRNQSVSTAGDVCIRPATEEWLKHIVCSVFDIAACMQCNMTVACEVFAYLQTCFWWWLGKEL